MSRHAVWLATLGLLLAGCVETEQEYTLNPDASGKVRVAAVFRPFGFSGNTGKPDLEKQARDAVRKIVERSKGVAAWKDVAFQRTEDGRIRFSGTAYFADAAKLEIHNVGVIRLRARRDDAGRLVVEAGMKKKERSPKKPPATLSDAQVAARVREERARYQQMKPMMSGMLNTLKAEATLRLPGRLETLSNFKKAEDGALRYRGV